MGLLEGRAGVVTGAAGGIGRAAAMHLAQEGAAVVVSDLASQRAAAQETVASVRQRGGRAEFVAADVTVEEDQVRLVAECVALFGRLDFAHNNAGVDLQSTVEATTVEQWDTTLGVNLKGVWLGMKHQLPQMRAQGGGSIVNTASTAGLTARHGLAAYIASKHGVVGITKAAAIEAGESGIRVNCVCPGAVRTPMLDALDDAHVAKLIGNKPIKRIMDPDEVAAAVVWLVSDGASAITGTVLTVDLGTTAGRTP